ncbi:MAG: DegV family protein [Lachnospiraceae bacterium]
MKYKIVADSSSNLTSLKQVPFSSVPLHIIVGDRNFVDDENVDINDMQETLKAYKGTTSTSCPSPQDWINAFGDAEAVFCVTITSALSGSYSSASIAGQMYEEQYPGRKVYLVDSLSTGPQMALLIEKLSEMILKEMDPEEINREIHEYHKHTHLFFSLASLDNLAKNGRVNPILAKGIGLLGIRVLGKASDEGTLQPMDKARGDKKAMPWMVNNIKSIGYNGGRIIISHANNSESANLLKELLIKEFGSFNGYICDNTALCTYYAEPLSVLVAFEDN